jgi:hypothetical protein
MAAETNSVKEERRRLALSSAIQSFGFHDPKDAELINRAEKIETYLKGDS